MTINEAYINTLLADATYALDDEVSTILTDEELKQKLETRMTFIQAEYISNNFTMVTHIDESDFPVIESGFDATVWQDEEKKTYVSMTGSEKKGDRFIFTKSLN